VLACLFLAAVCLRFPVLDWGLPPPSPHVIASDIRSSYAFDEDDFLTGASFTNPAEFNFDVRIYHWGTLHFLLTGFTLDAAEQLGYFKQPWRASYYNMVPGEFERVYRLGRSIGLVLSLVCIAAVYWLALMLSGHVAAFWAAAIIAVSPVHVLTSAQIRADVSASALMMVAAVLGLRALKANSRRALVAFGFLAGLTVAAKYSTAPVIIALSAVVIYHQISRRAAALRILVGFLVGLLAGEPYLVARWSEIIRQVSANAAFMQPVHSEFDLSLSALMWRHAGNVIRFGMGPVASGLAVAGILLMVRRRSASALFSVAGLTGSILVLAPLKWPLLRYQMIVLPWLALFAGVALSRLQPRWQWFAGPLALLFPIAGSIAQAHYMRSIHPANVMLDTILRVVPAGDRVARLAAEMPPLDRKSFPMGSNPLLDDLTKDHPKWVLTTDLPDVGYRAENIRLLATEYDEIATFSVRRILAWSTLGESGAPYDWKYTHPRMSLYRRRSP
jgi:hypothetical protein